MQNLNTAPAGIKPGPGTYAHAPTTPVRRLGYSFDPVPIFVEKKIRDGDLNGTDERVLTHLLRFRDRLKFSCWTSKATLAAKMGCSPRTVQRSFGRLSRAGVIAQQRLTVPDPDDPRNRTGWRIVFPWLAPDGFPPGTGPGGETLLSPPPETLLSPKYCARVSNRPDGIQPDETPSSSLRAGEAAPADRGDDDDSSNSRSGNTPESPPPSDDGPPPGPSRDELVALAVERFGTNAGSTVARELPALLRKAGGRLDVIAEAIRAATDKPRKIDNPVGYLMGVISNGPPARVRYDGPRQARERREAERRASDEAERQARAARRAEAADPENRPATAEEFAAFKRAWKVPALADSFTPKPALSTAGPTPRVAALRESLALPEFVESAPEDKARAVEARQREATNKLEARKAEREASP